MGEQAEETEGMYKPKACSLNEPTVCRYLMQLFPGLSKQQAVEKRRELLKDGDLKPYPKIDRENPEDAWCVSADSFDEYELKILYQNEETRKRMFAENKEELEKLNKTLEAIQALLEELKDLPEKIERRVASRLVEQREKEREKELLGG